MKSPIKATLTQPDLEKGTAPALRFLGEREFEARTLYEELSTKFKAEIKLAMEAPPEMDGVDFMARANTFKKARDEAAADYQKWAKALREFDKVVDVDSRDATESIPKDKVIKLCQMIAIYMNNAVQTFGTRAVTEIRESRNEQEAWKKTGDILCESILNSIKVAVSEAHLPSYCLESMEVVL